jgi:hypothetical protein
MMNIDGGNSVAKGIQLPRYECMMNIDRGNSVAKI